MKKLFSLFAAILFAGSMMADTATATLAKGNTNSYNDVTVNSKSAIKMGKSGAGGNMTITVGAGATSLTFHAVAWKGEGNQTITISAPSGVTVSPASITAAANDNLTGTAKAFTVTPESDYEFTVNISGASAGAVLTLTSAKRAIVWEATYEWQAVTDPYITAENVELGTIIIDGDTYTTEFSLNVTAANLTDDIDVSTNVGSHLSFSSSTISSTGGSIIVTVNAGAGEIDDQIVLTSGTATATVSVTGHVYEKLVNPGTLATLALDSNVWDNYFMNDVPALKIGTGKKSGSFKINIPADAKKLYFFAAAWSGAPGPIHIVGNNVTLSSTSISNDSITLISDGSVAGTDTAYFAKEGDWTKFQYIIDLSNIGNNAYVLLQSSAKAYRFVAWDIKYTTDSATGLIETEENKKAVKRFENGQLIIEKNGIKYNALGEIIR